MPASRRLGSAIYMPATKMATPSMNDSTTTLTTRLWMNNHPLLFISRLRSFFLVSTII
jgi:hypothetical protein